MHHSLLEAIVIGGGHAGLSVSYCLKQYGIKHIVFERGNIGESWRSQRWDSFALNTANKINVLPGNYYAGTDPELFSTAGSFVAALETYAATFQLPVSTQTKVIAVERPQGDEHFTVMVSESGVFKIYRSRQVIISSGSQNNKKIPAFAKSLNPDISQLHASEYRNASQLPDGAVLVVGSAQSGCQIAEDLIQSGKNVFLSTSMVARMPRRYRGKDIVDWLLEMKFFDVRPDDIADPKMLHMTTPQLTGTQGGKHTISLQALAQKGVTILGKTENASEGMVYLQPNAATHVQFADGFSKQIKGRIDGFILQSNLDMPAAEYDPEDMPDPDGTCASAVTSLNLKAHDVRSVIWSTGFSSNLNYLKLPVLDGDGNPEHRNGISCVEGLYFLGFPWLRTRKSSLIAGTKEDAEYISEKVHEYSRTAMLAG